VEQYVWSAETLHAQRDPKYRSLKLAANQDFNMKLPMYESSL